MTVALRREEDTDIHKSENREKTPIYKPWKVASGENKPENILISGG
jgi:hypothetical protein